MACLSEFLGRTLELKIDATLQALVMERFGKMTAIATVLERQYKKCFAIVITELLAKETRSAHSHNIDAGEVMGMFSALKKKVPNGTICSLASNMIAVIS